MAAKNRKVYTRKNVRSPSANKTSGVKNTKTYTRSTKPKPKASTPKASTSKFGDVKSAPRVKKPLSKEAKAKQVKASTKAANQLKRTKAKNIADQNKALKQFDKAKHPGQKLSGKALKAAKGNRAIQKAIGVGKHAGKLRHLKGLAKGGIAAGVTAGANWASDQVVDRTFRAISGKNKMSLKAYRAERDAKLESFKNRNKKSKDEPTMKTKPVSKKDTSGKKKITARSRMEAKNREIHGDAKIDALKAKHAAWKEARKRKKTKTGSTSTKGSTTKSSTKKSSFFEKKDPIKNLGKNTKTTSSKGKTTYETSTRAKGLAGLFGKKKKKKLSVPNLSNLK